MTKQELKRELKDKAEEFYYRNFNEIQLSLLEKALEADGSMLIEYIENPSEESVALEFFDTLPVEETEEFENKFIEETGVELDSFSELYEMETFIEDIVNEYSNEIRDFIDERCCDNYPMWNTLFELKHESPHIRDFAEECGFGIINPTDYTNTILFVAGAGYSFYAQHWIPLFLKVCSMLAPKYEGIDFSDQ